MDDGLPYSTIKSIEDQNAMQKDLTSLAMWANTWGMKFNMKKYYIMQIDLELKTKDHMYKLCGHVLEQVPNDPYLGVIIS